MEQVGISTEIFNGLHPHIMAALALTLAVIYLYKYVCSVGTCMDERRPIYLVRFTIWLLFGFAWVLFPGLQLTIARSIMRIFVAIIMISEISYNTYYIKDAIWSTGTWIYWKLFRTQR
jgi:hypothetical protein